ncbi:MFS transporter [Agrococcus sp. ARC_14]|uniref:MFS transporter n=1 Tax=Agrococcus sp. ARC_14 TaxID=2919927 RepID=UPI001F0539C6|nr:MFS transporter [Agrococcus sp. ARC_14]MCH1881947.1 MFS transporter [Agrococcus sp. ARC_14]
MPSRSAAATTASLRSRGDGRLAALAVGQVISWGILYYALIVAAPAIAVDTGWSLVEITVSFSIGLVASAIAGIVVGRLLDAGSPRIVMTLGSVVGAAGLVVVSTAGDLLGFTAGWIIVGVGQSAVLYQAAFTVIARRSRDRRRRTMTIVTLAGGLASTVFAPIVAGLLSVLDWRATLLLLAVLLCATTTPLHWLSLERRWPPSAPAAPHDADHSLGEVLRTRRFWMLELAMIALTASLYGVTLAVIPLFEEKGITYVLAAWALGLLGAGQVIGRLLYAVVPHGTALWVPLAVTAGSAAVVLALLAIVPGPPWLLLVLGILAGAVRGASTLVQGSAVADRWGTRNYGAINGVFAAPITAVAAAGPALGPLIATATGSYAAMGVAAAGLALVALAMARFA